MWGGYQILGFYDPKVPDDNQLAGLKYGDSSIVNCSLEINLNQYPDVPLVDSVKLSWFLLNLITSNTSIVKPQTTKPFWRNRHRLRLTPSV